MQASSILSTRSSALFIAGLASVFSVFGAPAFAGAQDPAGAQEPAPAPTAEPQIAVVYSSSMWQKKAEKVAGSFRIEAKKSADGKVSHRLILSDDFVTSKGPELKVVLSPQTVGKVAHKTALGGSTILGLLPSHKGGSSFAIPAGTDVSRFRSVLIHCEQYTKLWAAAPLTGGEILASGSKWTKKSNKIEGRWEVAKTKKGHVIRFGGKFKTKKAPDLKLVLSPLKISDAKNENALQGGKIIAPLRAVKGGQEYLLPAGIDLKSYQSLLIHCEQYTKLWGGVALSR